MTCILACSLTLHMTSFTSFTKLIISVNQRFVMELMPCYLILLWGEANTQLFSTTGMSLCQDPHPNYIKTATEGSDLPSSNKNSCRGQQKVIFHHLTISSISILNGSQNINTIIFQLCTTCMFLVTGWFLVGKPAPPYIVQFLLLPPWINLLRVSGYQSKQGERPYLHDLQLAWLPTNSKSVAAD